MNAIVPLLTIYLVWGSTYFAIAKALQGGFPPFYLGALRFLLAGSALYLFLRWRGAAKPTPKQWLNAAYLSFFMLALGNGLVNYAEQTVSSGLASIVIASCAFWIVLFASFRGDRVNALEILGLCVGFIGVLMLNLGGHLSASPLGFGALLLAPVAWGYGSIWARQQDLPPPFLSAAAQMLCASVQMAFLGWLRGESFQGVPSASAWFALFYLMFFGSILAYSAYIWLIQNVRAVIVGSYAYVNPLIAVLLGVFFANEHFGAMEALAMTMILLGVLILNLSRIKRIERK